MHTIDRSMHAVDRSMPKDCYNIVLFAHVQRKLSICACAQGYGHRSISVRIRISSVLLNMRKIIDNNANIITYANVPRKMASNQALPGPSTSGFSSPSESPWEVQQKEKVINLCLATFV